MGGGRGTSRGRGGIDSSDVKDGAGEDMAGVLEGELNEDLDVHREEDLNEALALEEVLDEFLEGVLKETLEEVLDEALEEVLDEALEENLDEALEEDLDEALDEEVSGVRDEGGVWLMLSCAPSHP